MDAPREQTSVKQTSLTERDWAILRYLAETRIATAGEIGELFWSSTTTHVHFRRLRSLREAGLLRSVTGDRGVRLGLALTKSGRLTLEEKEYPLAVKTGLQPRYKTTYDHDAILRKIRHVLVSLPVVSDYVGDLELRSNLAKKLGRAPGTELARKVPDATFRLTLADRTLRIALELEIARKSKARYRELVRRLSLSPDVDSIFLIVADARVTQLLEQALTELRASDPVVKVMGLGKGFYFVPLQNFLEEGTAAIFQGEGKSFTLGQLTKTATS